MPGFSDTFENDTWKLLFHGVTIGNLADDGGQSNLWMALHTADPGEAGTQGTNEATYGGYARVAVARTTDRWIVTGNKVNPAVAIDFPQNTSTSTGTFTHASVGFTSSSTGGEILLIGTITPNIQTVNGWSSRITTASTFTLS